MPKKPLTQQRVQRLAANPGERSKLSTGVLEKYGLGDLVRKRLLNQRLAAPVVPGSTMTGADLAHQANSDTRLQYGSAQNLLARQAQAAPDYYGLYAKILNQAGQSQQAQGQQSAQAIQGLYNSGPQAPNSPQGTIGAAQAGTASLLGDSERNFLTNLAAAAYGQGGQQRNQYLAKGADLAREAGAFNVSERAKIKAAEANTVATQAVAGMNAAAKSTTAAETHRHNVAQETKPPSAGDQKTAADLAFFKKHGYYPPTGPPKPAKDPKGPGGKDPAFLAPAGQQKVVQRVHTLAQYLNSTQRWPGGPKKGKVMTWSDKVNHLINAQLEPQNLVDAAKSLAQNQRQGRTNTLGPSGASALHSAGAQVHGHFKYAGGKKKK